MCGIIGIIGNKPVSDRLIDGLKRLEYRGYDSAGISTIIDGKLHRRRAPGKLVNLERLIQEVPLEGIIGIGHTRWATHGSATQKNTHPHSSDLVSLVHNGIIENHNALREELLKKHKVTFESDTDTEVIVHLITCYLKEGLSPHQAVFKALSRLEGAYAIAVIFAENPEIMIGARQGSPLAVGYGDGEMYLGSDGLALSSLTNKIAYLEEGDLAILTKDSVVIYDKKDKAVHRQIMDNNLINLPISKGEHRHFMAKEIFEQPDVIRNSLSEYLPYLRQGTLLKGILEGKTVSKVTLVACGTAFYACLVGKYWIEKLARIPAEVDIASEFRYREPPLPEEGVAIFVSQSGETADTLAALRYAKSQKQKCLSVVNVAQSSIDREADHSFYTHAGPEIGVASTKAFTTQLSTLACLSLSLAHARGTLSDEQLENCVNQLARCPELIAQTLKLRTEIKDLCEKLARYKDILFLGRGWFYPIALEGALKLKEISYIHAEGYPAGELKHGPIALIEPSVPTIVVSPFGQLFEKTASNVKEVLSRKGEVIFLSDRKGHAHLIDEEITRLTLPTMEEFIAPIVYAVPMQLLAYYTATAKGTDVDQPRNLAKSVTVE